MEAYHCTVLKPPNLSRCSSDERLLEYGVLETIFDEVTPYQHVQVVRTRDFGKILVLDGFHSKSAAVTGTLWVWFYADRR